jgi:hypothetical protein
MAVKTWPLPIVGNVYDVFIWVIALTLYSPKLNMDVGEAMQ